LEFDLTGYDRQSNLFNSFAVEDKPYSPQIFYYLIVRLFNKIQVKYIDFFPNLQMLSDYFY